MRGAFAIALAVAMVAWPGSVSQVAAEAVACGSIHVPSYAPVVTECMDWGIHRHPSRPVLKDGRWVIMDDGLEYTLMYNARNDEYASKDTAMVFYKRTGIQIRFGVAQPLNGREATEDFRDGHVGLYVESEYAGEWQRYGLPDGRRADAR